MSTPDENILRATMCLRYWLCYLKNATSNDGLFAESSLKFPFVESLERHNINEIELEAPHPFYNKKRVDIKIIHSQEKQTYDYIEFKYAKERSKQNDEQQLYFNDIMRLWKLHRNEQNSNCYFIVGGSTDIFNRCLRGKQQPSQNKKIVENQSNKKRYFNKKTTYKKWLSFSQNQREKRLIPQKKYVDGFNKEYNENYTCHNIKIMTKLVLLLPDRNDNDQSYSVGLWQIYSY